MAKYIQAAVIIILALTSFSRNSFWRDDGSLWQDAIRKAPNKARGYNELGLHYIHVKDYPAALQALNRSIQINRYEVAVYINLGLTYEGLNQTDKAIEAYELAIFMKPDEPTPYYNLGHLYYNTLKDREKAFQYFLKARDLNPLEPDVHQYLGVIYREKGDHAAAEKEFQLHRMLK